MVFLILFKEFVDFEKYLEFFLFIGFRVFLFIRLSVVVGKDDILMFVFDNCFFRRFFIIMLRVFFLWDRGKFVRIF